MSTMGQRRGIAKRPTAMTRAKASAIRAIVCQFLIVLPRTDPLVWRRIQVPEQYSFWNLHVAIQDAMGWQDYHLHEFVVVDAKTSKVKRIGIPDEDAPGGQQCLAGWRVPMSRYLTYGSEPVRYRYDFGDDWEHVVEFEEQLPAARGAYPRCIAGAGACPPEDVGGISGFTEFLRAIADPRHPEHASLLEWAGGAFDAHAFDPRQVKFDDPAKRWEIAFGDRGDESRRP